MFRCLLVSLIIASSSMLFGASYDQYEGPTFDVRAWRGETVYTSVMDRYAYEIANLHGFVTNGIEVAIGTVLPVQYREKPFGAKILSRFDCLRMFKKGVKIKPSERENLFCKVTVDANAKPGDYVVGPLKVTVIDRVLPPANERNFFLDLWQHPWAVSRYFDVKPFSNKHYKKMEPIWKALAECGQKALTVTILDLPWNHQCYDGYMSMVGRVKKNDGTWVFDYSIFDEYVEFGRKCGIGPDIACYTMCPWDYVVRWKDENGVTQRAKFLPGTEEFNEYWGPFLVDFAKHLNEKGWFKDTYIAMDERGPNDVRNIVKLIQEKAPGMKVAMAGNMKPSDFKDIKIDNFCQYLCGTPDDYIDEIKSRRKEGLRTTFYVCCFPERPNNFMYSTDEEGYYLGAYAAIFGFEGFLRWAANSWGCNPYKDATVSPYPSGDSHMIYPNGELSTRLVSLRAGIIAAEKANILKAEGLLEKELSEFATKYHFKKALKGEFNHNEFQKEFDALVNRK